MGCEQCREALSARLDNEDTPAERAAADAHLAGCLACRRWLDEATRVTRLVRMSVLTDSPGVSDAVLAAAPRPNRARLATVLHGALGVLGGLQLLLGLAQIGASASNVHNHTLATATGSGHLSHEAAAWNVAVGAGFLWIALNRRRSAGLIPVLTAFVGLLALLSVNDYLAARVEPARLLSHALLVVGYLITLALTRPGLDFGQPPAGQRPAGQQRRPRRWSAHFDDGEFQPGPSETAFGHIPPQSARHQRAA
jgi:predicted anti-sigma-YlaC factor YlaD